MGGGDRLIDWYKNCQNNPHHDLYEAVKEQMTRELKDMKEFREQYGDTKAVRFVSQNFIKRDISTKEQLESIKEFVLAEDLYLIYDKTRIQQRICICWGDYEKDKIRVNGNIFPENSVNNSI